MTSSVIEARRAGAAGTGAPLAQRVFSRRAAVLLARNTIVSTAAFAVGLAVLWLLGLVSSYTMGGFIHVLLVIAVIVIAVVVIATILLFFGVRTTADVVTAIDWPAGEGYFWMAGESAQMRAIRKHLMRERHLPPTAYDVMGYWRGVAQRQPRAVDPGPIWRAGKAAGTPDDQIWADFDAATGRGVPLVERKVNQFATMRGNKMAV